MFLRKNTVLILVQQNNWQILVNIGKTTAPSLKNIPNKFSMQAAFSGLVSLSNFKTSASEVVEKVNF